MFLRELKLVSNSQGEFFDEKHTHTHTKEIENLMAGSLFVKQKLI
jgi:hypothetical protein